MKRRTIQLSATFSTLPTVLLSTILCTLFFDHHLTSRLPPKLPHSHLLPPIPSPPQPNLPSLPRDANIAYFIQVTNSTARHTPRLISRLYHPSNAFVVHFDTKVAPDLIQDIIRETHRRTPGTAQNLRIIPSQIVTYAGYSMVLNTLSGMRALLDMHTDGHPWDFFINLSGSDYPLYSANAQRKIMGSFIEPGLNFMRTVGLFRWPPVLERRMRLMKIDEVFTHVHNDGDLDRTNMPNPYFRSENKPFRLAWSQAWMVVTRDFVKFSVESDLARLVSLSYAYTRCSDEHFFYTLAYNEKRFNDTIVPTGLRVNYWADAGEAAGAHPFYLDEVLPDGSFRFLDKLRDAFHLNGRKFLEVDSKFMDAVDALATDEQRILKSHTHVKKISERAMVGRGNAPALEVLRALKIES